MQVRFSNSLSNQFTDGYSVKQGGVLSLILFTVYIHNLIKILKQRNVGCKIRNKFLRVRDDLRGFCTLKCPKSYFLNIKVFLQFKFEICNYKVQTLKN